MLELILKVIYLNARFTVYPEQQTSFVPIAFEKREEWPSGIRFAQPYASIKR